jgi:hypothetical protein
MDENAPRDSHLWIPVRTMNDAQRGDFPPALEVRGLNTGSALNDPNDPNLISKPFSYHSILEIARFRPYDIQQDSPFVGGAPWQPGYRA